jgi:hypothetical protein
MVGRTVNSGKRIPLSRREPRGFSGDGPSCKGHAGSSDRGPRQDERKSADPYDLLGQDVIEGRVIAFQTEFSNEAVVFLRPRVRP